MKAFFRNNTVPMLLFTLLCSSTVYIYARSDLFVVTIFTAVSAGYITLLFAMYEALRKKGKAYITIPVVLGVMLLSFFLGIRLIETDYSTTFQWILEPSNINHIYVRNIASILLYFGFILGSALYYFTAIRYRSIFVFLICMCPFSLFAKTFTAIPVIYIILIATLFFILMIMKASGEAVVSSRRSYIALGAFVVTVVSLAAFLPKLESAPYREEFDELITGIQIGTASGPDFSGFSDSSSYSTSKDDQTVVFTFYGSNPIRIKRQCFNTYDPQTEQWGYYGESDTGYENWSAYLSWEDPSLLSDRYSGETEKCSAWVMAEQSGLRALYTPQNMTSIGLRSRIGNNIYRTPMDEYFILSDRAETRYYQIEWCRFQFDEDFMIYYDENTARANSSASRGSGYYKALSEVNKLYSPLLSEEKRRRCYKSDDGYRRVSELAAELTRSSVNAYEKAKAIEDYFLSDAFVYDEDFSPVDSSVENFIFNTRRGVCSDYATAMTLLCREAGLYSRYVEGFLVQKKDEKGNYYVTAADSHAYVQVWLDGYGWTDFDPTSVNIDGGYIDATFLIFGGVVLFVGVIAGCAITLAPAVKKRRFLRAAAGRRGREQAMMLFPELNRFLHEKLGQKSQVYTIGELKELTLRRFGVDVSPLADNYERAAYGGKETDELDFFGIYCGIVSAVKASEKEQKKQRERERKRRI